MKVFYLGVDVSKKKLDLCLRSNGKDILYDVIPNDLSSIKSWLTRTFEKMCIRDRVNKGWSKALLLFLCLYVTFNEKYKVGKT